MRPKCEAWYELLADWLFFTEPTVKSFELGQFARRWLNRCGGKEHMKHLDYVILSALEFDLLEVRKNISEQYNSNFKFFNYLYNIQVSTVTV